MINNNLKKFLQKHNQIKDKKQFKHINKLLFLSSKLIKSSYDGYWNKNKTFKRG